MKEPINNKCEICGIVYGDDIMVHIEQFHSTHRTIMTQDEVEKYYSTQYPQVKEELFQPKATPCDRCGEMIEPGLMNHANHVCPNTESIKPLTQDELIRGLEEFAKKWDAMPKGKAHMMIGKGFMEMIPDEEFVSYFTEMGEHYDFMMGKESYDYFIERWKRLGGP